MIIWYNLFSRISDMDNNGYERLNPNPKTKKNLSESRSSSQLESTISQGLYAQTDESILVS